ncbi:hypothetical protein SAMN05444581_1312 [Methylocapsa palsarum]|uniref:Uncharacterized protein n=1 Tax=Methylocapsa palsarum TaxID=1612308 RepID=A0A1I4CXZ3_9HYPH|nr:hypothetical protein SAMN05444581_1312 [Methylocapsa palsarum]
MPRHVLRLMMIIPVESSDILIIVVKDRLPYKGVVGRLQLKSLSRTSTASV